MLDNKNPSVLYKLIDSFGNNHLWGFIYTKYIGGLNLRGSEKVLDFGSGSGAGSKHFAKVLSSGHLTCVDVSGYWMSICKKRLSKYGNVDYLLGRLPEFKLKADSYDVVNIHYVLHEVSKKMRAPTINEMYRILKKGGRICIKEPQREGDGMPVSEIRGLMQKSGLSEVSAAEKNGTLEAIYVKTT